MSEYVSLIAADANDPHIAYAGTEGGLYVSAPSGRRWQKVAGSDLRIGPRVAVDPNRAGAGYTSLGDTVVRTDDGGLTWTQVGSANHVSPWAVARGNPDMMYGLIGSDPETTLVQTTDGGATWRELRPSSFCCRSIVAPSPERAYYLTWEEGTLGATDDGGQTWHHLDPTLAGILSLAVDPSDARVLYVMGPESRDAWRVRVLRKSVDAGHTWSTLEARALPPLIGELAFDAQGHHLYAKASSDAGDPPTIFVSTDGGQSFARAGDGLEGELEHSEVLAGGPDCVAYVGAQSGGLFKTSNGGGSCHRF